LSDNTPPPGILTDVATVRSYLNLLMNYIKDRAYRPTFFERINTNLGFSPEERMNHLHMYDETLQKQAEESL